MGQTVQFRILNSLQFAFVYIYRRLKVKHILRQHIAMLHLGILIVEMMILHIKHYTINVIAQPADV